MTAFCTALDSKSGALIWQTSTAKEFATLGGGTAHGGGINPSAAIVANGMVYVSSGDKRGKPGNVLLAFSVDGK